MMVRFHGRDGIPEMVRGSDCRNRHSGSRCQGAQTGSMGKTVSFPSEPEELSSGRLAQGIKENPTDIDHR